ncbi:conserved hypothetical protein, partial [delta proteobacterium NaphS2]
MWIWKRFTKWFRNTFIDQVIGTIALNKEMCHGYLNQRR